MRYFARMMAVCALPAIAIPAGAQTMSAASPETIVQGLQALGYSAKLETDNEGDPKISSSAAGVNFTIYFYGCSANANCQDLSFSSGFDLDTPTTAASMNEWNQTELLGKASIDDEGDPYIRHFVAGFQDVSPAMMDRLMYRWTAALGEFTEYIDW